MKLIIENGIRVYANLFCKCGCGKHIKYSKRHKYEGIPEYNRSHHPNIGFQKGHKWRFKKGKNNPKYIDGFGHIRAVLCKNSIMRGYDYIELNKPTKEATSPHHVDTKRVLWIPKGLHLSIPHSVKSGKNMAIVNALAFEWYNKNKSYCIKPQSSLCNF